MKERIRLLAALALSLIVLQWVWPQYGIEARYIKNEFRIPMRDGKKLFTAVYRPRDTGQRYPIMLNRTPYGIPPYGENNYPYYLGPSQELADSGFIFVYQDVRGRMMSEGDFIYMTPVKDRKLKHEVDESTDTYDTIEWLLRNIPDHNGKVGMWGISFPGFYAAAGMIAAHPALKAVSPQAPIADWFIGDDFHHNGAFFLAHAFGFLSSFGYPRAKPTTKLDRSFNFPTPDGYSYFLGLGPLRNINEKIFKHRVPFWNEVMRHGSYDEFWQSRNIRPHLKGITPAVMTVGGWFDAENLFGSLAVYQAVERQNPDAYNILVMGPWYHGGWAHTNGNHLGNIHFGSNTAVFYRNEIEAPFFNWFLKGTGELKLPEATVFLTGSNEWRSERQWPPAGTRQRKLYFRAGASLDWAPDSADSGDLFDEYVSDPARPVPYTREVTTGMVRTYMVEDQRFASSRPDVLTYESAVLERDVTIAGPVIPVLHVSTTGTDSDFIVKLIDVYPDSAQDDHRNPDGVRMGGFQQLVRGEPFRGRFRNSFSKPEPFVPNQITKIEFPMPDIFHTFRKGHRIMIQVQSSWFPLVDRNPQQFVDIYQAKSGDFKKATQRVYRSRSAPSHIILHQLEKP